MYLLAFALTILAVSSVLIWRFSIFGSSTPTTFDGKRAYRDILAQVEFGSRIPGTEGNQRTADYIGAELRQAGWIVESQDFTYRNTPVRNVMGRANLGEGSIIILGAHYDTRRFADRDPKHPGDPVPGANDGASGVAVLLELARVLDLSQVQHEIWMAFFDAEDNGDIDDWDWIVGSTYVADHLNTQPEAMILLDMVGDVDQQIYFEGNSDHELSAKIWTIAAQLGYGQHFIPQVRWTIIDDHIPFVQRGIPAVDIIDFDYPHWHTVDDTPDKISPESLERVGRTLQVFLETTE